MDGSKQKGSSSSSSSSKFCIAELFGPKETPAASSLPPSTSKLASILWPTPTGTECIQPWNCYSSINYGGREDYSTPSDNTKQECKNKKNVQDDEGNDPTANWWKGSVYY